VTDNPAVQPQPSGDVDVAIDEKTADALQRGDDLDPPTPPSTDPDNLTEPLMGE
jgi:hypothetical protein